MSEMRELTCVEIDTVEGGYVFTPGFFENLWGSYYSAWYNPYWNGYYRLGTVNDYGSDYGYYDNSGYSLDSYDY